MSLSDDIVALGKRTRLVLLMEKSPLSDEYRQVQLTQAQFNTVTDLLFRILPAAGKGQVVVSVDNSRAFKLTDLKTTFEPNEIATTIDEEDRHV